MAFTNKKKNFSRKKNESFAECEWEVEKTPNELMKNMKLNQSRLKKLLKGVKPKGYKKLTKEQKSENESSFSSIHEVSGSKIKKGKNKMKGKNQTQKNNESIVSHESSISIHELPEKTQVKKDKKKKKEKNQMQKKNESMMSLNESVDSAKETPMNSPKVGKKRRRKAQKAKSGIQGINNRNNPIKKKKNMLKLNVNHVKNFLSNKDELLIAKEKNEKVKENVKEKEKETGKKKKISAPLSLRDKMMAKLKSSRFRYLNEQMYNSSSYDAKAYFKDDPESFFAYHEGYKQQVEQWPINPLDVIIKAIQKLPEDYVIADFGCGEAKLAESVKNTVHSFDLVAVNEKVQACDISQTPLLTGSVNVVVFCLSLMGTNLQDYILEANRVLKKGGILKIAEVKSRFESFENFVEVFKSYGFTMITENASHDIFQFMDFKKVNDIGFQKKLPEIQLNPCVYKKR